MATLETFFAVLFLRFSCVLHMDCILIKEQLEDKSFIDSKVTIKSVKILSHKKYRICSNKINKLIF